MDWSFSYLCGNGCRKNSNWDWQFNALRTNYTKNCQFLRGSYSSSLRGRQRNPDACPWHLQNVELYQESVVLGLDFKLITKDNHGTCPKGNACPHPCLSALFRYKLLLFSGTNLTFYDASFLLIFMYIYVTYFTLSMFNIVPFIAAFN